MKKKLGTAAIVIFILAIIGAITFLVVKLISTSEKPEEKPQELSITSSIEPNKNKWINKDFKVKIESQEKQFIYCMSDKNCEPDKTSDNLKVELDINTEGTHVVCAKIENQEKVCETYNLDKTAPTIGEVEFVGNKGSNDWYTTSVLVKPNDGTDELSGHAETTASIEEIKENTKGTEVIITTKDKADNETSKTYNIKIDKDSPKINFKTGDFNVLEGTNKSSTDYFNIEYSLSGGKVNCNYDNIKNLSTGNQTITCTVTGNNGFTAKGSKTVVVKPRFITNISNDCIRKGNSCSTSTLKAGVSFTVRVNGNNKYKFYVLSDSNDELVAIMDRNLGSQVNANSLSYSTVINKLNSELRTSTNYWDKDKIKEVRLPKIKEIATYMPYYDGSSDWDSKYANRLLEFLEKVTDDMVADPDNVTKSEFESVAKSLGYTDLLLPNWLSSNLSSSVSNYVTSDFLSTDTLWNTSYYGIINASELGSSYSNLGIRPVIVIDKDNIE